MARHSKDATNLFRISYSNLDVSFIPKAGSRVQFLPFRKERAHCVELPPRHYLIICVQMVNDRAIQ